MKKKIVIFGGSGFIGMNLVKYLEEKEYNIVVISRNRPKDNGNYKFVKWNAQDLDIWTNELKDADIVVNLVGRSVDCIKNAENCDAILRSRVDSTNLIGKALKELNVTPEVWVQMSTAHIYGDSIDTHCTEESTYGYGLAPYVAKKWEEAYKNSVPKDTREVILRTSFVLGKKEGALPKLALLAKLGLGGTIGHGKQGISWIHEDDLSRLITKTIEDKSINGIFISSAPNPISNKRFMKALRDTIGIPFGIPAFEPIVKFVATNIVKTDYELVLCGRYCSSKNIENIDFEFKYKDINSTLKNLLLG